ncbi:hypothetical protein swp_1387 [Shewanella piezotolerans WP3]|uniref:Uncharacterized protein n=1 Tax=Shewanella piezotolerans (strain WP3 / JCM 13877) TaxID=225849 RepID=B8CJS7_SHEPW|nr:hypothetical protein swp_1387 [Shewanella piezotolerans WP3]
MYMVAYVGKSRFETEKSANGLLLSVVIFLLVSDSN